MLNELQTKTANRLLPVAKWVQQLLTVLFCAIFFVIPVITKANSYIPINFGIHASTTATTTDWYLMDTEWELVYPDNADCNAYPIEAGFSTTTGYIGHSPLYIGGRIACEDWDNSDTGQNPTIENERYVRFDNTELENGYYLFNVVKNCTTYPKDSIYNNFVCQGNDAIVYYQEFYWDGMTIDDSPSTETRVISSDPTNGELINQLVGSPTSTSSDNVLIELDTYFNSVTDGGYLDTICVDLQPIENPNISLAPICNTLTTTGFQNYQFDFGDLLHGTYYAIAYFTNTVDLGTHFFIFNFSFTNMYSEVPNQSCLYGDTLGVCNEITGLPPGYATSTLARNWGIPLANCDNLDISERIFCGTMNMFKGTINFLFVPNGDQYIDMVTDIKEKALTHFPLGYITDFINKVSTTSVGTLTILDITVPNGVVGAGSQIELDMTGVLDQFLNATTSAFAGSNPDTDSTDSLFETTNYYWKIICYVGGLLYMIRRLVGGNLIPHWGHKEETKTA